eukprot:4609961-Alexandrium_andersonii.AAC.1
MIHADMFANFVVKQTGTMLAHLRRLKHDHRKWQERCLWRGPCRNCGCLQSWLHRPSPIT